MLKAYLPLGFFWKRQNVEELETTLIIIQSNFLVLLMRKLDLDLWAQSRAVGPETPFFFFFFFNIFTGV